MNAHIERIVRLTDGQESADALPPREAAQADMHRALGLLLKQAYTFKPAEAPLAFMGERVLARARTVESVGFAARLRALWGALTGHPMLAWSGASLVVALAVTLSLHSVHLPSTTTAAQSANLRSFIIYDTPDGNGFIQCFEYESTSPHADANENS